MNNKLLTESDIRAKFITPHLISAGWNEDFQIRRVVNFTDGRIYVRGKIHARDSRKRADYILYYKSNIPIAVVKAKDNTHTVSSGIQQALGYARALDVPFVFSSNGDGFYFHDRTITDGEIETNLKLTEFPSPEVLWEKYKAYKGISDDQDQIVAQDYISDGSTRSPRYYQQTAVNRTVEVMRNEQAIHELTDGLYQTA